MNIADDIMIFYEFCRLGPHGGCAVSIAGSLRDFSKSYN